MPFSAHKCLKIKVISPSVDESPKLCSIHDYGYCSSENFSCICGLTFKISDTFVVITIVIIITIIIINISFYRLKNRTFSAG
jgi:hypothetical protein